MKVLLFSNDTMPFGALPTSGGGLRCWQLYQGLRSAGIEVVASMPAFTYLTKKYFKEIPEDVRENLWEWHTQDAILERVKPDAVLFASNWDHYNLSNKPSVPLIIDLHGSRLIETSLWGNPSDTNKKVDVFSKADCLICAGLRQRMYFYGWLCQAGRVPELEHLIRYIPISLSPDDFKREDIASTNSDFPLFVSGGGWFPWQDQSKAIYSICNAVVNKNKGLVKIYGTPHDNSENISPEETHIRSIFNEVKNLSNLHPQIEVVGYVGRDDLLKEYARASVALELMQYNLERELAFTTRTIEYLWCGLPVIYNNYAEISTHISDYNAGWTIDPTSEEEINAVIQEIYENPSIVKEKSLNAKRLVKDRFTWDKTITPLVDYLHNPEPLKESRPAKGFIYSRASYYAPSAPIVHLPIEEGMSFQQSFIFPAEGIWALEVPYSMSLDSDSLLQSSGSVYLKVKSQMGLTLGKKTFDIRSLQKEGVLFLQLSRFLRPRGGASANLEVRVDFQKSPMTEDKKKPKIFLNGLSEIVFPLTKDKSLAGFKGLDQLGQEVLAPVFQIRFHPGNARLYHLKSMFERCYWLVRQGEIKRVLRAVLKRIPALRLKLVRSLRSYF